MNNEAKVSGVKIQTTRFGEVTVPEEALLLLPSGLIGFPQFSRFVVFDAEGASGYQWLQSAEDPTLALIIVSSDLIKPDFKVEVPDESLKELEIAPDDPLSVSVIITIPKGQPEQATANLRGPLIVNLRNRKAKQVVLQESIPLHFPLHDRNDAEDGALGACTSESMHA